MSLLISAASPPLLAREARLRGLFFPVGAHFVMEVNPSLPAKTVAEFIANAKANPGKISYGSGALAP